MGARLLPDPPAVASLFSTLLGSRARASGAAALPTAGVHAVATYEDAGGRLAFVAVVDVALLSVAGAALAMIPRGAVDEAVKSGRPSSVMVENAYEVLNVMASLFNDRADATHHVKIRRLVTGPVPPEVVTALRSRSSRADLVVTVPGYPDGRLTFVVMS